MKTLHTIYTSFAKRLVMLFILLVAIGIGNGYAAQETLRGSFLSSNTTSGGFTASGGTAGKYYKLQTGYIISDNSYSVDATKSISISMKVGTFGNYSTNKQSVDFYAIDKNGNIISNKVTASFSKANSDGTTFSGTIKLNSGISGNEVRFKFASNSNATSSVCARFYNFTITYESAPTTFSVTYNANGAESGDVPTDNQKYTSGASVPVLGNTGNLVKTGYRFDGWQINKSGTVYNAGGTFNISENTTLYAKWTARTLTNYRTTCTTETSVTLNLNGGKFATEPNDWTKDGDNYKKEGVTEAITLPTPTKTGYNFDGWYDDETKVNSPYTPSETVTLDAKWTAKQTQLSINANTANHGSGLGFSVVATYGEALPSFNPCTPATGYTLNGYYTAATDGTKIIDKDGKLVSNVSNYTSADGKWASEAEQLILYAQYIINTYTVKFDNQGHGSKPDDQTINHGGKVNNPGNLTENGFIFGGWYKEEGCSNAWDFATDVVTSGTTLYAKWTAKIDPAIAWNPTTCTVTIDAGEELPIFQNPNNLTPISFESSNSEVASVDNNGVITLGTTATIATVTITATFDGDATYAAKEATCTLTVHPSNCRWVETEIGQIQSGDEVVITMTTVSGVTYALPSKKFTSGAPNATEVESDGNSLELVIPEIVWIIYKNDNYLTFESKYNQGNYLAFTNDDTGVRVNDDNFNRNFVVDDVSGYLMNTQTNDARYLGVHNTKYTWYSYKTYSVNTGAQTLKFYKREECLDSEHYWVTWDAGEGAWEGKSSKKIESYTVGAAITKPADPYREGYRFDGWSPEPTIMPAQNTTFTAKWTEVYKVTWYENGVPSYTYVPSDNAVVTWEDNIADCGEKQFYGWTADDTFVSDPTTPPTLISKGTTIAGDVTYYAVYADAEEPANSGYTKVTTISEGTYLIAAPSRNIAYKAVTSDVPAVISNNVISSLPEGATELLVELGTNTNAGYFAISYNNNGTKTYIYGADKSLSTTNTATYDWSLDADNATLGEIQSKSKSGYYIQANNTNGDFKAYAHTQTVAYLYKKQTTTYKNFAVSCATYTITVTPPTGGTVTTNPTDEAGAGQEITINVTPADCKYLTALKYNDGSDHSINIASAPYTFTMPAADVTITATFADKTATDIEVITSAHRLLMQGSAFVGEQVRITYNNGDKETLNWNDSRLTFTGHNTATLGSQTVTVTYNDCGTQSASYNIEVIDGLGITFWDGDYTETIKYEPGDLVDVDNRIGQNICSGWEFAGWSETKVANESEEYVPVHNFNATDAKVLYAVYVKKKAQWTTIVTADEAKSGAKYVLAYDRYGTYYALTSSVKDVNYLAGKVVTSTEGELNSFDVYYLSAEPTADLIWELVSTGENGKWYLYNKNTAKYIDLSTQGQIHLTDLPSDKLQMESGYNDSQIRIASSTVPTYYLSWDNSNTRYNTYASSNSQEYWYTKDEEFTSTPPCSPLSATFHGNGGTVTDGVKSGDDLTITEPTRDAGITTPTASFADCNGKSWTFVGWSDKEVDVTRVPVLTTDLLHDGGGNKPYKIQEDGEEFWAVYTNQGNPETIYGTITFTQEDWGTSYSTGTKTKTVGGIDYSFSYERLCKASTPGIQFEENNGKFANATSLGKINSIRFGKFNRGDIDDLKVYVGKTADNVTTALTAADLQVVENTYTYYPSADYAFFKVVSVGEVCYVEEITIDYGQPTKVWATTPDCSIIRILTDEELYVTATKDRGIMATAPLTIKTQQLDANADVVITSTSSDVYFSATRDANFAKAAANQPKTSLTLNADADGNLQQEIYVHYKPSTEGNGTPASVVVSANLATPNPSVTDDQTIYVRNLPAKFVIATKVGATWYALPANMSEATNPEGVLIEVDEASMTATAPNTASYTLFPVKTTNGEYDRYATNTTHYEGNAYGDRVRFAAVNNGNKGLWATSNGNTINNNAKIESVSNGGTTENTNPSYEWKISTTIVNGNWQYTLQTDQLNNQKYLRYWTSASGGAKWGTYASGNEKLYFLPVTTYTDLDLEVMEWGTNSMVIRAGEDLPQNVNLTINGTTTSKTLQNINGSDLYKIDDVILTNDDCGTIIIDNGSNARKIIRKPLLVSGNKSGSEYTTSPGRDICAECDIVILNGGKLIADEARTTGSHVDFANIYVYPGGKLVLDGNSLGVKRQVYLRGGYSWINQTTYDLPEVYVNGDINFNGSGNIIYDYYIQNYKYYQFSLPYQVPLTKVTDEAGVDNFPVWVKHYNGALRAANANATSWEWYYGDNFEAGIGYIIAAKPRQKGKVANRPLSIIRFPLGNSVILSAEADKSIATTAHGIDAYNAGTITANNVGWNFIGNPFMATWKGGIGHQQLMKSPDAEHWNGSYHWENNDVKYITVMSPEDGTDYAQYIAANTELKPFFPFYLQETAEGRAGTINFAAANRIQKAPAELYADEPREAFVQVEILTDRVEDQTGVFISDTYSDDIDFDDYEKIFGSSLEKSKLWFIHEDKRMAFEAMTEASAAANIALGYRAPRLGKYTFAINEDVSALNEVVGVYLTDHELGVTDYNLLYNTYEFETEATNYNDQRFTIRIALRDDSNGVVTGVDNIGTINDGIYKFIYQDKMYIYNEGIIYDATGKQVTNINK